MEGETAGVRSMWSVKTVQWKLPGIYEVDPSIDGYGFWNGHLL